MSTRRCDRCRDGRVPREITIKAMSIFNPSDVAIALECAQCHVPLSVTTKRKLNDVRVRVCTVGVRRIRR